MAHHEDRAGHAVGDDHAEEPERAGEEEGDDREGAEEEAVAALDERAGLHVRLEQRDRLRVGLVEPEAEDQRDHHARETHHQRVLELEPAVDQESAAGRGRGRFDRSGIFGHVFLRRTGSRAAEAF